jgi:transposase
VAVTLQGADHGDTETLPRTLQEAAGNFAALEQDEETAEALDEDTMRQAVLDKGYHSNDTLILMDAVGIRTYVSEPDRGRRSWKGEDKEYARHCVYANRRRIRGAHGKALLRQRGEKVERTFAHLYETGAMRRTHLRQHDNTLKRLLIHAGGYNLSLLLRQQTGIGKPRTLQDAYQGIKTALEGLFTTCKTAIKRLSPFWGAITTNLRPIQAALQAA